MHGLPMPSEKQEITLVMQSYHLATLELGERWEQSLKHSSNGMSEASGKVVQDKLGVMWCCSCVSLVGVSLPQGQGRNNLHIFAS